MQKKQYVNLLKGLAIFLVTWGHCIQHGAGSGYDIFNDKMFQIIYSFHMPLFMLISGYLFYFSFQKRNLGELIKGRVQSMLQPIIVFGVVAFYLTTGIKDLVSGNVGGWFNGSWLAILDDLWFLWSVLANSIWIALIYKLTSKKFIQIIGLILGFVWVMLFPNMMLNLYMYPYFVIGFLLNKYENCIIKKKYIKNLRYVSILLFPLMMVFYRKEHFIYVSGMFNVGGSIVDALKIDLYRYAIGLIGSIFVFSVVWWLKIIKESRFAKMLEKLGGMTLEIYCLNLLFVSGWMPLLANYIISVTGISYASTYTIIWDLCISLLVAIVMILIMMGVIVLLKKSKIGGVLFGR